MFTAALMSSTVAPALVGVLTVRVVIVSAVLRIRTACIVSSSVPFGSFAAFVLRFLFATARVLSVFAVAGPVSVAGFIWTRVTSAVIARGSIV